MPASPGEHGVHVWRIDPDVRGALFDACLAALSPDELERAEFFCRETDKARFIVARAAVRQILSRYISLPALSLRFSYNPMGKPELVEDQNPLGIRFNLSHSGECVLLAVTANRAIGVDVEVVNWRTPLEQIADSFFAAGEAATLKATPAHLKARVFFTCWTRKEAYIKALGGGLSLGLSRFEITCAPQVPARLLRSEISPEGSEEWSLCDLDVGEGFAAALAVEGEPPEVRMASWPSWHLAVVPAADEGR